MDLRLVTAALAVILSIIGYVILVISGNASEAEELLKTAGLPALTFIIGLGSSLINAKTK